MMVQVLAYILPLVLAVAALVVSWMKCVDDPDGRPFRKRILPAGWWSLTVVFFATGGLLYVQYVNQNDQDAKMNVLSDATDAIRSTSKNTADNLEAARADLARQSKALGEHGQNLSDSAKRLEQLQRESSAQGVIAFNSHAAIAIQNGEDLGWKQLQLNSEYFDDLIDFQLSVLDYPKLTSEELQRHQREILATIEAMPFEEQRDNFVKVCEANNIPPEKRLSVEESISIVANVKNNLKTKQLNAADLRLLLQRYRFANRQFWNAIFSRYFESRIAKDAPNIETLRAIKPVLIFKSE